MSKQVLESRAQQYARLYDLTVNFEKPLGYGNDGYVWRSSQNTAIKVIERERAYRSELYSYQRLEQAGISEINGLAIPTLVNSHDKLMIIEMDVVTPPYLIDFGKVWLDRAPDYSQDAWDQWESVGHDDFGDRWGDVKAVLAILQQLGIHYVDPKLGNINFGDSPVA